MPIFQKTAGKLSLDFSQKFVFVEWKILDSSLIILDNYLSSVRSPSFLLEGKFWHIILKKSVLYTHTDRHEMCMKILIHEDGNENVHLSGTKIISKVDMKTKSGRVKYFENCEGKECGLPYHEVLNACTTDSVTFTLQFPCDKEIAKTVNHLCSCKVSAVSKSICQACERDERKVSRLSQDMKMLYTNQLQCDFTIVVQQQEFKVHKAILMTRSSVFGEVMKNAMEKSITNTLNVSDCDTKAFHLFLVYLYSGETEDINTDNVIGVYTIANKYSIHELKAECINYLKKNYCIDKFCDIVEFASKHQETELLNISKLFFIQNAKQLFLTHRWQMFMKDSTRLANEFLLLLVLDK